MKKQQPKFTKKLKGSLKPKVSPQRETSKSTRKKMLATSDEFIKKAGMQKHFRKAK